MLLVGQGVRTEAEERGGAQIGAVAQRGRSQVGKGALAKRRRRAQATAAWPLQTVFPPRRRAAQAEAVPRQELEALAEERRRREAEARKKAKSPGPSPPALLVVCNGTDCLQWQNKPRMFYAGLGGAAKKGYLHEQLQSIRSESPDALFVLSGLKACCSLAVRACPGNGLRAALNPTEEAG